MKSLLLKIRGNNRASREASLRSHDRAASPYSPFLCEDDFVCALSIERKRAERSRKLLLVMLLEVEHLRRTDLDGHLLSDLITIVTSTLRETDVRGWNLEGKTLGVIFTEIAEGEKTLICDAISGRINLHLTNGLGNAAARAIRISFSFFPEDWKAESPGCPGTQVIYPELLRSERAGRPARALKRMIDVAGSVAALIALSPLCLVLAILVKATSEGPVLYRQKRIGFGGRPFECLKFRSMNASSNPHIHQTYVRRFIVDREASDSPQESGPAIYKLRNDPRVTPFGRFLRKSSLDEIPQFWNVIKGEMSLVGPRPPIPYEIECYDLWHRRRLLEVKPGITGLWQVSGRSRTTFDNMVRLDLQYARRWSVWLDLKILLKTPGAVLSGEGAV